MAVYRPTYKDPRTGKRVKEKKWWCEFVLRGKRVRKPTKTTRKTLAVEYEKNLRLEMERAYVGLPIRDPADRIRTVTEVVGQYLAGYKQAHREHTFHSVKSALKRVERSLGPCLLPDVTEERIRRYVAERRADGVSGRAINVELGELSRAIGQPWSALWPHIRKLEERQNVGRALTREERDRLLAAVDRSRSPNLKTLIRAALLTGTRAGELTGLHWAQVDFCGKTITIGQAKTKAGTDRVIPMNDELVRVMAQHADWFTRQFGETAQGHFVFPFGSPYPCDPCRPTVEIKTAWNKVRRDAKVNCRWHDLRHSACSDMNEGGVSEAVQLAIFGWSSRKMIERYSHIGTAARRTAMNALSLRSAEGASATTVSDDLPKDSPKEAQSAWKM